MATPEQIEANVQAIAERVLDLITLTLDGIPNGEQLTEFATSLVGGLPAGTHLVRDVENDEMIIVHVLTVAAEMARNRVEVLKLKPASE